MCPAFGQQVAALCCVRSAFLLTQTKGWPQCHSPTPPGAARLVLVAPDEWSRGMVRVKDLAKREEADVPVEELA